MPIPARPAPHFIVIQADFRFGLLKAALNSPAAACHPHDLPQGCGKRGKDHIRRQVRRGAQAPPDQQPAAPAGHRRQGQGLPAPVRPPRPLGAIAGTAPCPARRGPAGQQRFHLALRRTKPPLCLARDRQDRGLGLGRQPPPQAAITPVHAVAGRALVAVAAEAEQRILPVAVLDLRVVLHVRVLDPDDGELVVGPPPRPGDAVVPPAGPGCRGRPTRRVRPDRAGTGCGVS